MPGPAPQLTLELFSTTQHDFDDYLAGPNAATVSALQNWCGGDGPRVVYLWGGPGTGKSHLLQAAVRETARHGARAMYLPLGEMLAAGPAILDGLEQLQTIALDDVDAVRGREDWEQRLFHLYNALGAADGRLLWAAAVAPASGIFKLKDLQSRLSASLVCQLHELDDGDKAALLRHAAERRGLVLAPAVIAFILRRQRRDVCALLAIVDALDRASLRDGRALTIPFVREVLAAPAA